MCRLIGKAGIAARYLLREHRGQRAHALHLIADGAELGVIGDAVERRYAIGQADLLVLLPEELRIGEAGAEHALIAGDDDFAAVIGLGVGDDDEARRELAVFSQDREVFLIDPHGRGHDLGRQRHERVIDASQQCHGPFHEAGHFVQQRIVLADGEAFLRGQSLRLLPDLGTTLGRVEDDLRGAQLRLVVGKIGNGDLSRRQEAMAVGIRPAAHGDGILALDSANRPCGHGRRNGAGPKNDVQRYGAIVEEADA